LVVFFPPPTNYFLLSLPAELVLPNPVPFPLPNPFTIPVFATVFFPLLFLIYGAPSLSSFIAGVWGRGGVFFLVVFILCPPKGVRALRFRPALFFSKILFQFFLYCLFTPGLCFPSRDCVFFYPFHPLLRVFPLFFILCKWACPPQSLRRFVGAFFPPWNCKAPNVAPTIIQLTDSESFGKAPLLSKSFKFSLFFPRLHPPPRATVLFFYPSGFFLFFFSPSVKVG